MKKYKNREKKNDFRVFHGKFTAGLRKKQKCASFSTIFLNFILCNHKTRKKHG
jgi:hypothetical protein